jgi:hypothetical protein
VEVEGGGGDGSTGDMRGKGEGCHCYLDITLLWMLMVRCIYHAIVSTSFVHSYRIDR